MNNAVEMINTRDRNETERFESNVAAVSVTRGRNDHTAMNAIANAIEDGTLPKNSVLARPWGRFMQFTIVPGTGNEVLGSLIEVLSNHVNDVRVLPAFPGSEVDNQEHVYTVTHCVTQGGYGFRYTLVHIEMDKVERGYELATSEWRQGYDKTGQLERKNLDDGVIAAEGKSEIAERIIQDRGDDEERTQKARGGFKAKLGYLIKEAIERKNRVVRQEKAQARQRKSNHNIAAAFAATKMDLSAIQAAE